MPPTTGHARQALVACVTGKYSVQQTRSWQLLACLCRTKDGLHVEDRATHCGLRHGHGRSAGYATVQELAHLLDASGS